MKVKQLMKVEDNSAVYNRLRKLYLANTGCINCGFCPYHGGENIKRYAKRSWKRNTKRRRQYEMCIK